IVAGMVVLAALVGLLISISGVEGPIDAAGTRLAASRPAPPFDMTRLVTGMTVAMVLLSGASILIRRTDWDA
ncbi:MAG: hypothetical protein OEO77_07060, partial [Acidimicrobiia bacterium]|nr:hypothetical protein [Acidimicrobiia bacterium]